MNLIIDWSLVTAEDLPESTQELIDLIGLEKTLILIKYFRGTRIYVPKIVKVHHRLVNLIGLSAVQILSTEFGGWWITLPKCQKLELKFRNFDINQQRKVGKTVHEIAREVNLTGTRVRSILKTTTNIAKTASL